MGSELIGIEDKPTAVVELNVIVEAGDDGVINSRNCAERTGRDLPLSPALIVVDIVDKQSHLCPWRVAIHLSLAAILGGHCDSAFLIGLRFRLSVPARPASAQKHFLSMVPHEGHIGRVPFRHS